MQVGAAGAFACKWATFLYSTVNRGCKGLELLHCWSATRLELEWWLGGPLHLSGMRSGLVGRQQRSFMHLASTMLLWHSDLLKVRNFGARCHVDLVKGVRLGSQVGAWRGSWRQALFGAWWTCEVRCSGKQPCSALLSLGTATQPPGRWGLLQQPPLAPHSSPAEKDIQVSQRRCHQHHLHHPSHAPLA